ncbi:MraY family glycosyltransferase [Nonlabens marinus]|uniref:Undecaprenyl-phosphate N-acetylglucosaminyl 1-phosphate transferase n=1 Tax=Nonlabens marinus S1-08 TaxID=1454201 RepID=W8VXY3_9FLAO|nr:glycosyltransferase family 4 protein [Nonlabens marinus]BAO56727.1 undecaprenyl-phosphate N-acetylglucosaminyl 1-phosphate transferase [Nonlabens marinus S1-08]
MTYLLVFLLLVTISYVYYRIADRFDIVDKPNHRSSHTLTTIRGGGILFYASIFIYFIWSGFQLPYLFLGVTLIAVVSFIDDLQPLPPMLRLPVQFLSIALVLIELDLGYPWFALAALIICGVGFINFYNFMDGINGLTALYSLVVVGSFVYFHQWVQPLVDFDLLVFLVLSILVFAFYNVRGKALFFSGDVGSISMAVILFYLLFKLYALIEAPAIVLIIGVYGIDACITILKRFKLKESIHEAHRHHMYQILVDKAGLSHLSVAIIYCGLQIVLFLIFLGIYQMSILEQVIISFVTLFAMTLVYLKLNYKFIPETLGLKNA